MDGASHFPYLTNFRVLNPEIKESVWLYRRDSHEIRLVPLTEISSTRIELSAQNIRSVSTCLQKLIFIARLAQHRTTRFCAVPFNTVASGQFIPKSIIS